MNQKKDQNQKIDWKKKGLGWLPEYPDLRDYDIDNEEKLRLKVEGKTGELEKIAEAFMKFLEHEINIPRGFSSTDNHQAIENATEKIRGILGSVTFIDVKHHKLYRYSDIDQQQGETLNKLPYKRRLSQQHILSLKKYLALLIISEYFPNELLGKYFKTILQSQYSQSDSSESDSEQIENFIHIINKKKK
ncbi:hypothetical protein [Calothrix rhizosoleniae]|uniref:hypothetical protein n=1 Tax=Calothrix rhizosoleniae TaxID=888997 RepID=UPI000B49CDDE|nr:hypothetical protein [Calothrix rhizosoleniae]